MSNDRWSAIRTFIESAGWGDATIDLLAGDASFRKYYRLNGDRGRAVLMDAPPPQEDIRPFSLIGRALVGMGYSAPKIWAEDASTGLMLLEDLGDDLYSQVLRRAPELEEKIYGLAIDLLVDLHHQKDLPNLAPYDAAVYQREADLLIDWFLPAQTGQNTSDQLRTDYHQLWQGFWQHLEIGNPVLVLRDYHADNLLYLPERNGIKQVGLLDFQDGLIGSPAYDLVSLLEDARRDVRPELGTAMIQRYLDQTHLNRDQFSLAYALLGAQRNAKIIGIFTRLWQRDGKPQYLKFLPRVWAWLEHDLTHPGLGAIKSWFDKHVSTDNRNLDNKGKLDG